MPKVKVETCTVGIFHDFREQFLNVEAGDILQIAVKT